VRVRISDLFRRITAEDGAQISLLACLLTIS
jgi:hypothetical protein